MAPNLDLVSACCAAMPPMLRTRALPSRCLRPIDTLVHRLCRAMAPLIQHTVSRKRPRASRLYPLSLLRFCSTRFRALRGRRFRLPPSFMTLAEHIIIVSFTPWAALTFYLSSIHSIFISLIIFGICLFGGLFTTVQQQGISRSQGLWKCQQGQFTITTGDFDTEL